jgi:hypothetical protein
MNRGRKEKKTIEQKEMYLKKYSQEKHKNQRKPRKHCCREKVAVEQRE